MVLVDVLALILTLTSVVHGAKTASFAVFLRFPRVTKLMKSQRMLRLNRLIRFMRVSVPGANGEMNNFDDEKRSEVLAYRVPFENFAGYYDNIDSSPLHLITKVAKKMDSLDVFESPILQATIDFKWNKFARSLFYRQFAFFLSFLVVVVLFGTYASRTARPQAAFPGDTDAYPTLQALADSKDGFGALVLIPFVVGWCGMFLFNELNQLIHDGLSYFGKIWNYVDMFGFGLEMVAAVCWLARADEYTVRGLLALGTLLLFIKILYFARGFYQWGPLVRMLVTIIDDMRPFVLILVIFVSSFAVALLIFNAHEQVDDSGVEAANEGRLLVNAMLFVVASAVFGDKTGYTPADSEATDLVLPTRTMNTFLFSFLMVIVNIILLNLLIAIMADSYGRVQQFARLEAVYERATIIMEMEQSMLPLMNKLQRWRFAAVFRYRQAIAWVALAFCGAPESDGPAVSLDEAWGERSLEIRQGQFPTWLHVLKAGNESRVLGGEESCDIVDLRLDGKAGDQLAAVLGRLEKVEKMLQLNTRLLHKTMEAMQQGGTSAAAGDAPALTSAGSEAEATGLSRTSPKSRPIVRPSSRRPSPHSFSGIAEAKA